MKNFIMILGLYLMCTSSQAQNILVKLSDKYSCDNEVFFAVRTEIANEVSYRLTVKKSVSPGGTVSFDLDNEMSNDYLAASAFADPTRPMFGGVTGVATYFYDAGMEIDTVELTDGELCPDDAGKVYKTRDGEFHYSIADDLNGLLH